MDQIKKNLTSTFLNKLKKKLFWPILRYFPIIGAKTFFERNPALSHTTLCRFLTKYQNQEKTNDQISRKCLNRLDGQTDGKTEEQGGPIRP